VAFGRNSNEQNYLLLVFLLAASASNWVPIITTCAESIATNFGALATASLPNFMRASAVIFIEIFKQKAGLGVSKTLVPVLCPISLGVVFLKLIPETSGKDFEFIDNK
jgi:hypothetical protein